jgi:hypothetical protein
MQNNTPQSLYDLLLTRDFEPKATKNGAPPLNANGQEDILAANMFEFNYKTPNKNYGTVVILLGDDNNLVVYYGDNVGRSMETEDKTSWYNFLEQLKSFAVRNMLTFELDNIKKLKYTMQGLAAIKEGLFEGYYGNRKVSYSDQPKKTRLVIKHNRALGETDARFRNIDSLFVETENGERYRVPSRSLMHGKLLARHCSEGGNPYDAFGRHINDVVTELSTLSRFIRASKNKEFGNDASEMVETAIRHYSDLKAKAKHMISKRGYQESCDSFDPASISDVEITTEAIRNMFVTQMLDQRIEEALPILARLQGTEMKEADEFESWTDSIVEGTWALPDTAEAEIKIKELMSKPLIVGADATNATEQLYDLVGDDILFDALNDLADKDPNANVWDDPKVMRRLAQLGIDQPEVQEDLDTDGVMMTRPSNMSS